MRDWPSLLLQFPPDGPADLCDLVAASLDADAVAAVEERSLVEWLVSYRTDADCRAAAAVLTEDWGASGLVVSALAVSDEDWARRSQAALGAIRVGAITIVPPWLVGDTPADPDARVLIIEPSMGFGSGHHATTRLCLTALQRLVVRDTRVLDIGTGSGILALAAASFGAAAAEGIDNDPDALESARADAVLNHLEHRVIFREVDFRVTPPTPADTVLANLTGSMLAANVGTIAATVRPGGRLILSGITTAEADMVLRAWQPVADVVWRGDEDGWVGLLLALKD